MARRNPMNERYTNDKVKPKGQTRRSASAAKPKSAAANSVTTAEEKSKKDAKLSRKERKEAEQQAFKDMGPRAREKYLEDEYVRWNTWRKRCVMLSFICLGVAVIYQFSIPPSQLILPILVGLWALPFIAIGVGMWISFARQRPLGRLLGIEYGKKGRQIQRKSHKERQQAINAAMQEEEARVKARVQEKHDRTAQRETARLQRRAEEEAAKANK